MQINDEINEERNYMFTLMNKYRIKQINIFFSLINVTRKFRNKVISDEFKDF